MNSVRAVCRLRSAVQKLSAAPSAVRHFSTTQGVRGQGWAYRDWDPPASWQVNYGLVCTTLVWWWIFHGIFTEPEHILGHEPLPDVVQFTDEELGIPKE